MTTTKPKWHEGPMVAFDIESTGTSPATDRIVTASVVYTYPDQRPRTLSWLINPGIPIPDEAAEVHGWTTERLTTTLNGAPAHRILNGHARPIGAAEAIYEITSQVAAVAGRDEPLVVFNAAYDLTMLEAEATRHEVSTVSERPYGLPSVLDPFVLDKQHDPYRKSCYKAAGCDPETSTHACSGCRGGKVRCGGCGATDRKLTSLCQHYRVVHTGAHDATGDALATVRLAGRIAAAWPDIARLRLATLHQKQIGWREEQQAGLRKFFDRVGKEHDGCCGAWPVHTAACARAHREVVAA